MTGDEYSCAILVNQLARKISVHMNRELEQMGLTLTQFRVLEFLIGGQADNGEEIIVYQKDIEKHFMLSNPAVSGVLQRLEAKGLVERRVMLSDCRRKAITATEEAYRLFDVFSRRKTEEQQLLLRGIDENDLKLVIGVLEKMLDNFASSENNPELTVNN